MVTRSYVLQQLQLNKEFLRDKFNVERIGLFGSYARNEQTNSSDIDILVEFSKPIGWEFVDLKEYLEHLLEKKD